MKKETDTKTDKRNGKKNCLNELNFIATLGCQIDEYTRLFGTKET